MKLYSPKKPRSTRINKLYEYHYQLTLDVPTFFPFSSNKSTPFEISFCLIKGILTQFAAATAANGTYLYRRKQQITFIAPQEATEVIDCNMFRNRLPVEKVLHSLTGKFSNWSRWSKRRMSPIRMRCPFDVQLKENWRFYWCSSQRR